MTKRHFCSGAAALHTTLSVLAGVAATAGVLGC